VHGPRVLSWSHTAPADVLQKRPTTPTLKKHTIAYLRDHTRSFAYTLGVLRTLERQARAEIARLGGNEGLEKIMDLMHVPGTEEEPEALP
jgi:geranylgeranyl diphosphate synthase type 3